MFGRIIFKAISEAMKPQTGSVVPSPKNEALEAVINDDPIAQRVDWGPCKRGGSSYKTRILTEIDQNHLEYKSSFISKLFPGIFMFQGGSAVIALLLMPNLVAGDTIFPIIFGSFAFVMGYFLWTRMNYPIMFDLLDRVYWTGSKDPRSSKVKVEFDDIYAIQLVSELVTQKSRSRGHTSYRRFRSVELNFIFKDGERINVIDHGDLKVIREDAQRLSKLIGIPVWDAV